MNKDDILKDFDTLVEAKRKGAVNLKLCLGFALVVVVLVLVFFLMFSPAFGGRGGAIRRVPENARRG